MADPDPSSDIPGAAPGKVLIPAARRALEEAAERRAKAPPLDLPPEEGGQAGPEPTRYGDWEKNGIASDF
ncbi:MAG TPA: DUF1674 domain-containing protein [Caulobacteraceae bacterium]|jgi:hypothetical protein|nr:DUF1674 domain-containing protein [Caulobacteraceae bacterium]